MTAETNPLPSNSSESINLDYIRRVFTESEANALPVKEHSAEWAAAVTAAGIEFDNILSNLQQTAVDDWKNRWL